MPRLAAHIEHVPPSGIRSIFETAVTLDDVVMLALGEPDAPTAQAILDAGSSAWLEDRTDYTPNGGIAELRRAVQRKLETVNGLRVDLEQVWATNGGTHGLYLAMALTLGPGDEVLIPDPGYSTFAMNAAMLGAVAIPYPLRAEHGFQPDLDELERLVTERTRLIVVNSPSNPLGTVVPRQTLQRIVELAVRHDLWVLSDGRSGEGWIRICVAASADALREGIRRLPAPSSP